MSGMAMVMTAPGRAPLHVDWLFGTAALTFATSAAGWADSASAEVTETAARCSPAWTISVCGSTLEATSSYGRVPSRSLLVGVGSGNAAGMEAVGRQVAEMPEVMRTVGWSVDLG